MPVALIAAAATIGGAAISANASNKASKAATNANNANNALQASIYGQNKEQLSPYITRGNDASERLSALLGLGGDTAAANDGFQKYLASTGYQFTQDSGTAAITGSQATKGLLNSGSTLKDLTRFSQGNAQQYFGGYLSNLSGIANTGAGSASALAGVGQSYANSVSANNNNTATNAGNAALASASNINALIAAGLGAYGQSRGQSSFAAAAPASNGMGGQAGPNDAYSGWY